MNNRRALAWIGFIGLSAALAWAPGHWFGQGLEEGVALSPRPASAAAPQPAVSEVPGEESAHASGDLFPSQQWAAPSLAVIAEPAVEAPPALAPSAPALPFQFIGRLGDRDGLQVFLQDGEKLYVVRQGDVIDDTYRLDHVSATELGLVYLPLHQLQTLTLGSAP